MMERASFACDPDNSRGRLYPEPGRESRGPRNVFQRDRDRIIHSIAFRRLRHKTQVFVAPDGDHYRVRLTHSLEVAQIGRTIARALGLDEDLTEALCLAHDIGHPPFGHAGEDALEAAMLDAGGFDHNGQTLRVLTRLESPYPDYDGLNLSWEMLEGLAKHNGPVAAPQWALAAADAEFSLNLGEYASLEAQVAAIADDIAYDNHDIDDGLRAGILDRAMLMEQPFVARNYQSAAARFPGATPDQLLREVVRSQIGLMVNDVIRETQKRTTEAGVKTVDDVREAGQTLATFSAEMATAEREMKAFLYAQLYHHPEQIAVADAARTVVGGLFGAYRDERLPLEARWGGGLALDDTTRIRSIGDYVSGMTDRFATDRFVELFGRDALPPALAHV